MAVAICAFVTSGPPRKAVKAAILCRLNDSIFGPERDPCFCTGDKGDRGDTEEKHPMKG